MVGKPTLLGFIEFLTGDSFKFKNIFGHLFMKVYYEIQ